MDKLSMNMLDQKAFGKRLFSNRDGQPFPYSGQWELTCRCNLRCIMCYTDCFNTPDMTRQELSFSEIVRIMDELCEAGCFELCFTGGEPLARRDFLDIYTSAKQKGFLVTVFTNGTLITPKIADHLAAYPPTMIEISFHGLTRESFDHITQGRGSYDRCLEGIRLLLERDLPLTLKTVGMTVNRDEVLKIKEYAGRLGKVQYKFGSDLRPRLDGSMDVYRYQLPREDIKAIEQADAEFCAERCRQDGVKEKALRDGTARCGGGRYKFHIDAYGQLQLCSSNRRQGYDLRHGTFKEGFYRYLPQCPCPMRVLKPVAVGPVRGSR